MSDEVRVPDLQFEESDNLVIDVVEDSGGGDLLSQDEIMVKMAKIERENEELLSKANEISALRSGFDTLGDRIVSGINRPSEQSKAPMQENPFARKTGESESEWKQRLNQTILDDPSEIIKMQNYAMGPLMEKQVQTNLMVSKRFIESDPNKKDTYFRYQEQIENEVQNMPPNEKYSNSDIYTLAHDRVVARNIGDYKNHLKDSIKEEILAELGREAPSSGGGERTYNHTESTSNQLRGVDNRVKVNKADMELLKREALKKGISLDDHLRRLKSKGDSRVK